jgi:hypothetical protein
MWGFSKPSRRKKFRGACDEALQKLEAPLAKVPSLRTTASPKLLIRHDASLGPRPPLHKAIEARCRSPGSLGRKKGVVHLCPLSRMSSLSRRFALLSVLNNRSPDHRPSLPNQRSLRLDSPRQDDIPDHHLCRPRSADIRPQARSQPRLHHAPPEPRRCHRDLRMEGKGLCGLG